MFTKIASFWEDFLDLLFPRTCVVCRQMLVGTEKHLCTRCLISLPRLEEDGMAGELVGLKFAAYPEVISVRSFLHYQPKTGVQRLLRSLKYQNNPELGVFIGRWCASEWKALDSLPQGQLLVPVPLHKRKEKARGYNQSACFCVGFSEETGIPLDATLLERRVYTASQTTKSKIDRISSMTHVFSLRKGVHLSPIHILLVDDVLTTGATLEACVEVLIAGGCRRITVITIAAAQS